jgi:hypothetical protein
MYRMISHHQHRRQRRERSRSGPGRERKQRVLHTRISERLAEDIRDIAEELRVPVSNLVRNVLEEAFAVVESVTDNVGDLVEDMVEEAERARHRFRRRSKHAETRSWDAKADADPGEAETSTDETPRAEFPDVVGWQTLILNRAQSCADCGDPIERGEPGFAGITTSGLSGVYLCSECVEARR